MIRSFSTLYAGHVLDGDGVGFGGTPADDRWYSNERLIEAFDISREAAQLTEDLGFDVFWMAEHHFQREGYKCIPNLLMFSLWLAERTRTIKLGRAFNILPMWHPIRLAENFAMADILTNGRVVFGIGRGYHTREVERSFGTPEGAAKHIAASADFDEVLETRAWVCGTPGNAVEYLKEMEEKYPRPGAGDPGLPQGRNQSAVPRPGDPLRQGGHARLPGRRRPLMAR